MPLPYLAQRIYLSGFDEVAASHLGALCNILGGTRVTTFERSVDYLVVASTASSKVAKARSWYIPAVSEQWLFDVLLHGAYVDTALRPPPAPSDATTLRRATASDLQRATLILTPPTKPDLDSVNVGPPPPPPIFSGLVVAVSLKVQNAHPYLLAALEDAGEVYFGGNEHGEFIVFQCHLFPAPPLQAPKFA